MTSDTQNIVSRYVQRRVLLLSLVLLGILFVVTAALARMYHAREQGLVEDWFRAGNTHLEAGEPNRAFVDFRNALSYDPDNPRVQLRLAEALLAANRSAEARSYLVNLWEKSPGSGQVNLDLAHDSEQMGDDDQAVRYFRDAIFSSWDGDSAATRRKVRYELCEFLISRGQVNEAQAEIAGLASDVPAGDGALHDEVGHLFLRVGEPAKALIEFQAALRTNPRQSQWLADAGRTAFDSGDDLKAEMYFAKANRENPSSEIQASLALLRKALGDDPYLAGLSEQEQARRTWRDFQQAARRVGECAATRAASSDPGQTPAKLQLLDMESQDLQKRVNLQSLVKSPEMRKETMQLVFQIEDAASQTCGPAMGMDQAILRIEKRHEGTNP